MQPSHGGGLGRATGWARPERWQAALPVVFPELVRAFRWRLTRGWPGATSIIPAVPQAQRSLVPEVAAPAVGAMGPAFGGDQSTPAEAGRQPNDHVPAAETAPPFNRPQLPGTQPAAGHGSWARPRSRSGVITCRQFQSNPRKVVPEDGLQALSMAGRWIRPEPAWPCSPFSDCPGSSLPAVGGWRAG